MKNITQLLIMALCAIGLSSCCTVCKKKNYIEGTKEVTVTSAKTGLDAKGGMSLVETKRVPVKHNCTNCGSVYCPQPGCCGIISKEVTSRATGQVATGEPFIGLIPTMKTLAPKAQ